MKPSSLRLFTILGAITLFICSILVYQNLISPAYNEVKQSQGEYIQKEKDLKDFQSIFEQVKKVFDNYESNYGDLQSNISVALPTNEPLGQVINQVTKLALINGLSVQSVSIKELALTPSRSSLVKNIGTTRFSLKLIGTYDDLKGYLNALESNIRIMSVNSLKIDKVGNSSNLFNFNIEVDSYYQSQQ